MSDNLVKEARKHAQHHADGTPWDEADRLLAEMADRIEELEAALKTLADDRNWFDLYEDGQKYPAWRGPTENPEELARAALEEKPAKGDRKGFDEYGFYGENNPPVGPMSSPSDKDYEV